MKTSTYFAPALTAWFANHPLSIRTIAEAADLPNLFQYRTGGRCITRDALAKLLPVIEQHSDRAAAATLLLAYLADETPDAFRQAVTCTANDASGRASLDDFQALAAAWEARARTDSDFFAMWQALDLYMHQPENIRAALAPGAVAGTLAAPGSPGCH